MNFKICCCNSNKLVVGKLWTAGVSTCGQQGCCPSGCPRSRPQLIHDLPSVSFHVRNKHLLQAHFILEETPSGNLSKVCTSSLSFLSCMSPGTEALIARM